MKEESTFPYDNWYLEFTEEQRPVVDNWRINIIKYSDKPCPSNMINWLGQSSGWLGWPRWEWGGVKITFEEFCRYVLNKRQEPEQPQDYNYLIEFLNNKQIK